jgi:hypothetical protein
VDAAAFVDLSVRRCHGRLAAVWFGAGLYLAEIAFCPGLDLPLLSAAADACLAVAPLRSWAATVAFFAGLAWYRCKKREEAAWLQELM